MVDGDGEREHFQRLVASKLSRTRLCIRRASCLNDPGNDKDFRSV